jgi:predicted protein tyrosine phosphatase
MNRKHNARNPFQGAFKKVLTVCSAGLLRSPTAAVVLSQEPYNFNTRAAGAEDSFALIPVDEVLLDWADEVVFMTEDHFDIVDAKFPAKLKQWVILGVPDTFEYRNPELMQMIRDKYDEAVSSRDNDADLYI